MNIKRTSLKYYNEKVSDGILLILALVSDALQTLYLDGSMLPLLIKGYFNYGITQMRNDW